MKKPFNPEEWEEPAKQQTPQNTQPIQTPATDASDDIEVVTQRIEAARVDITGDYATWRDIGFALSDQLGENGRDYYHRISRFYPGYTEQECDQQYDRCMRAHGTGVTIKTFFQAAKDAGISVSVPSHTSFPSTPSHEQRKNVTSGVPSNSSIEGSEGNGGNEGDEDEPLPTFALQVRDALPGFFQEVVDQADNEFDADILLIGSIVCISACLPNLSGVYDNRSYWPNLYLFVTAQASSGKGRLTLCKHIIQPIHDRMREINEAEVMDYKQKMREYEINKKKLNMDKPEEPPLRMLFLPANASSTAFIQVLNENDSRGIMFETEGDTLANTFSSDYGNYSDHFRKFTHHETVSYVRRKDREFVCVDQPCVSCVLSGTPKQVSSLIPDAENDYVAVGSKRRTEANDAFRIFKTASNLNAFAPYLAAKGFLPQEVASYCRIIRKLIKDGYFSRSRKLFYQYDSLSDYSLAFERFVSVEEVAARDEEWGHLIIPALNAYIDFLTRPSSDTVTTEANLPLDFSPDASRPVDDSEHAHTYVIPEEEPHLLQEGGSPVPYGSHSRNWEAEYTDANGKWTKIANPAVIDLIRPYLAGEYLQPLVAFNLIQDYYGDRLPQCLS